MSFKIVDTAMYKEEHINNKGESVVYYSVDVYYRHNGMRNVIGSDWIAAIDGKLMTETDGYVDYIDEYHFKDFPIEEITKYQDISLVNSYYSDDEKRQIYPLFSQQLATVLAGFDKELTALYINSL